MKCLKHPKYLGKGQPRNCSGCLSLYFSIGAMRKPIAPAKKVQRDVSKYTRKMKHKKGPTPS